MRVLSQNLTIVAPDSAEIQFRRLRTAKEHQAAFRLRYEIYVRRLGFVSAEGCSEGLEYDEYDTPDRSTHFGAFLGERLVGTVRAIHGDPLPTSKIYEFAAPRPLEELRDSQTCEISRLAALRTRELGVPRVTLLTGLLYALATWSADNGQVGGYGFMVEKSLANLEKWGAPVRRVRAFRHIRDEECRKGRLYNSYNSEVGEVTPVWFFFPSVLSYLSSLLFETRSFDIMSDDEVRITGLLPSLKDKLRLYLCCHPLKERWWYPAESAQLSELRTFNSMVRVSARSSSSRNRSTVIPDKAGPRVSKDSITRSSLTRGTG